jgi:GTP-binding protein
MLLRRYAIPHQIVISKVDKVLAKKQSQIKSGASAAKVASLQTLLQNYRPIVQPDDRSEGPGALGEILTCSPEATISPGKSLGISAIRWAILSATGFDANMKAQPMPTGR